jgi:hypothetical protein
MPSLDRGFLATAWGTLDDCVTITGRVIYTSCPPPPHSNTTQRAQTRPDQTRPDPQNHAMRYIHKHSLYLRQRSPTQRNPKTAPLDFVTISSHPVFYHVVADGLKNKLAPHIPRRNPRQEEPHVNGANRNGQAVDEGIEHAPKQPAFS